MFFSMETYCVLLDLDTILTDEKTALFTRTVYSLDPNGNGLSFENFVCLSTIFNFILRVEGWNN